MRHGICAFHGHLAFRRKIIEVEQMKVMRWIPLHECFRMEYDGMANTRIHTQI